MWWSQRGHKWRHSMAHAFCVLDKLSCTRTRTHTSTRSHTHTQTEICNTYCFSTATMVTWTRLNVMLYEHFLSCLYLSKETRLTRFMPSRVNFTNWTWNRFWYFRSQQQHSHLTASRIEFAVIFEVSVNCGVQLVDLLLTNSLSVFAPTRTVKTTSLML
jgi:hypothetical protein